MTTPWLDLGDSQSLPFKIYRASLVVGLERDLGSNVPSVLGELGQQCLSAWPTSHSCCKEERRREEEIRIWCILDRAVVAWWRRDSAVNSPGGRGYTMPLLAPAFPICNRGEPIPT